MFWWCVKHSPNCSHQSESAGSCWLDNKWPQRWWRNIHQINIKQFESTRIRDCEDISSSVSVFVHWCEWFHSQHLVPRYDIRYLCVCVWERGGQSGSLVLTSVTEAFVCVLPSWSSVRRQQDQVTECVLDVHVDECRGPVSLWHSQIVWFWWRWWLRCRISVVDRVAAGDRQEHTTLMCHSDNRSLNASLPSLHISYSVPECTTSFNSHQLVWRVWEDLWLDL